MTAFSLDFVRDNKPWGRHRLWPGFVDPAVHDGPVGEVIFDSDDADELLVKYLFTSDKLSIQVHPDDRQAVAAGFGCGKDEAWVILQADPGATIALGLKHPVSAQALRAAAQDGSIETLVDWKPVKAGDVIYSPAGTIHAIGSGITLIEIQQNVALTYRLYDYGRPRELHLDAGIAVSTLDRFEIAREERVLSPGRTVLAEGRKFVLERWGWSGIRNLVLPACVDGWLIPVFGIGTVDGHSWQAGECWKLSGEMLLSIDPGSECLFAYPLAIPADLFD